jgi:hypothetical protein
MDTKLSALPVAGSIAAADQFAIAQSGASKSATASVLRQYIGEGLYASAVASVSAAYAADTYLAGSAITIPAAGSWRVGTILKWQFDMTKTAAGAATPILTVRMGTLGTTGDAAIATLTWAAGTAAVDTGTFDITAIFRTIGAGTAAVLQVMGRCTHHLAATGLVSTGASGTGIILATSAGFNSTTQTIIGLSFNGGASFAGTSTYVFGDADNI